MFRRALLSCLIASLSLTTSVALFPQTGPFEGWTELVGSQDLTRSRFGHSIALSRNTLAVSAPESADGGAVYVFERGKNRPDRWSEVARLTSGASGAAFGWSIALDEDKLIVGAPAERTNSGSGAVYIYYRNRGGKNRWGLVRRLKATSQLFGWSVSISGNTALASADGEVHVLERDRGGPNRWQEVQLPPPKGA